MENEIKELKSVFRSLVVSSATEVDVRTLLRDYRTMVGKSVPIAKYGYKEPVLFLKERFSDCFLFRGDPHNPVLTLIVPETLKHIDKFVQKQKVSNTIKHKAKRRSVAAPVLLPSTNLITETFFSKQKEKSTTRLAQHNQSSEDNKPNNASAGVCEDNEIKVPCGTSHSPLERFMQKRMPLLNNSKSIESEKSLNDTESSKGDGDSGRQTFSSSSSTKWTKFEKLKNEIKNILEDHPEGIWCTDLIALYRERHGRELQVARFGFTSVLSLACSLDDDVRAWRPHGAADWRLQHAAAPQPPVGAQCVPPSVAPARYHRAALAADIDPDDALPGVDYDPDVFPEDCLHFMESIPPPSFAGLVVGAPAEVIVGEVYSPSHFWLIRLGQQHNVLMEDIMDEMTEYYARGAGRERRLARGAVRVGQYCTSCYEGDWHRSLIVKVVDSDTVKVRHVDYGTVERCAVSGLRPLLRRWGALPQQAIRARLAAVRPPDAGRRWLRASTIYLLRAVTQRQLVALLSAQLEDILEVLLIDTSSEEDVCINTEMIQAGYADPREDTCLGTSECYLCPSFDALETGDTPTFAEIQSYLRDGIVLDFVEDYRRHVPPCVPGPAHPPSPVPPPPPPLPPPPPPDRFPLGSRKAEAQMPETRIPQPATDSPRPSDSDPVLHQPPKPLGIDLPLARPAHVSDDCSQHNPSQCETMQHNLFPHDLNHLGPRRNDTAQRPSSPYPLTTRYPSSSHRRARSVRSQPATDIIRAGEAPLHVTITQNQTNLLNAENEICFHLRQARMAQVYMVEAIQRALAVSSLAGTNSRFHPEAVGFQASPACPGRSVPPTPPVRHQTEATSSPAASPAPLSPGDKHTTINPAVQKFFENAGSSAIMPIPPGFEYLYHCFLPKIEAAETQAGPL